VIWPPPAHAVDITFGWSPPDTSMTGVPIPPEYTKSYNLEYSINGGAWVPVEIEVSMVTITEPVDSYEAGTLLATATVTSLNPLNRYRVRVQGVNQWDEAGTWSVPSVEVRPIDGLNVGPPGQAGMAVILGVDF
jgi:hypothetical protein